MEQRCARIRGRMVWILSQLEGDGSALIDMADLKLGGGLPEGSAGGANLEAQLRAQQEAHDRELEEELARQESRLQADHEAELEETRSRLAAAQATEMRSLRAQLASAQEEVRAAKASGGTAARDAKLESERERGAAEAAHRAEAAEQAKRVAELEKTLRDAGPLLAQAAAVLPPTHATGPLATKLAAAQRRFELVVPGSAPSAPESMLHGAAAAPSAIASSPMAKGLPPKPTAFAPPAAAATPSRSDVATPANELSKPPPQPR